MEGHSEGERPFSYRSPSRVFRPIWRGVQNLPEAANWIPRCDCAAISGRQCGERPSERLMRPIKSRT